MTPLTTAAVSAEKRNNPEFTWFYEVLEDFIRELPPHPAPAVILAAPDNAQEPGMHPFSIADLDFSFFISKGGGFKNGLWATVPSSQGIDIFLRVGITPKLRLNVNVFSSLELTKMGVHMKQCSFAFPPHFAPRGCFKTSSRVRKCRSGDIMGEIINLLTVLCRN